MIKYFADKKMKMFELLQSMWMSLKEIVYVLRILYETTIAFQSQKLTLSDVYGRWIITQLHLKQCSTKKSYKTGLAQHLYDALAERKEKIFKNPLMEAAIFLDPRFHIEISKDEAKSLRAKETLLKLHRRMNILETVDNNESIQLSTEVSENLSFDFNPDVAMAHHLGINRTIDTNTNLNTIDQTSMHSSDIESIIDAFQPELKPLSASVFQYWLSAEKEHKELYKLALAIFSVPPTEVQIERDFSSLKFVFSERRCSISNDRLEDIMLIHLNKDLFDLVNQEDIEAIRICETEI